MATQAELNPDAFVGKPLLSAYEPNPLVTNTAFSSNVTNIIDMVGWFQPLPVVVKNIIMMNSMAVGVPGATSQASTGTIQYSYAYTAILLSRQDFTSNSTNFSPVKAGTFGLTAGLSYSSTSQSFVMNWVTDSTGGTSAYTTTSNDAGWSNFASGQKFISIPFVTTIPAGEYWMAFQHQSSSGTTNSNVTLLSMSQLQQNPPALTVGALGGSVSIQSSGQRGIGVGVGISVASLVTTTTIAANFLTMGSGRQIYFALSNA